MVKAKDLNDLNSLFEKAERVDKEIFAEMRSNILLVSGEHYSKAKDKTPIRSSQASRPEQKLRLIKNHMHRVSRKYKSSILAESPAVKIRPQIDTDLQDKKDAELNLAVWQDIDRRHDIAAKKTAQWCGDFVDIGEVCIKIFWDPMAGELKGFEGALHPETGEPHMEETGEMEPGMLDSEHPETGERMQVPGMVPVMKQVEDREKPIFSGDFVFERIFAFNLLRDPSAQDMHDRGRPWIVRKMMPKKELLARYQGDKDKLEGLTNGKDETYVVFDANKGTYEKAEDQVLIREFYWPICYDYPMGYFIYATKDVILEEGELPGGIWPFAWAAFDEYQTSPRGRSMLKVARPYQAEINRSSSQTAVAQVTLGDDKILYQGGTKLTQGSLLPGVRGIAFNGAAPTILPGRDGSQYTAYTKDQVAELDQALMISEIMGPGTNGQTDPYALLMQSATQKKIYSPYTKKFDRVLVDVADISLRLAKIFLPDDALIPAIGAREQVNMEEFRKTTKLSHQIVIEPGSETLDTMFGRMLQNQHILQYIGKDLDKREIGKLINDLPFQNSKDGFSTLTMDDTVATNQMLALERGKALQPNKYVDATYMLQAIGSRIETPEFEFMDPMVQQNYQNLLAGYEALVAEQEQKIKDAQNEFIPVDGPLVTVDLYVNDPTSESGATKKARVPSMALSWLMDHLEKQGANQQKLEGMNSQILSDTAQMLLKGQGQEPPQAPQALPMAG